MIRGATTADIPLLVNLINESYRPYKANSSWTNEAGLVAGHRININQLNEIINHPASNFFVYLNDYSQILGCVNIELESNVAHIGLLTVAPNQQQLGIGNKMLRFAESYSKETHNSIKSQILVLLNRSELVNYYLRRGYEISDKRYEYPIDANFGTPLSKDIVVVLMEKSL